MHSSDQLEDGVQTELRDKVALITGAGGEPEGWSVGKAIAVTLAKAGAHVAVLDLSPEAAEVTRKLIQSQGGCATSVIADVRVPEQLQRAVETCASSLGRLDILVNNVALGAVGSVVETEVDVWDRLMDVNLRAAYLSCKYAMPALIASAAGSVVNISSLAAYGYTGAPLAAYSTSKAGLHALSREVAVHFAPRGVRCNTVVVGLIDTPMIRRHASSLPGGNIDTVMRARDARVPLGRQGTAWDVAHVVRFLTSPEARFVNGAEIVVDGGSSARTT